MPGRSNSLIGWTAQERSLALYIVCLCTDLSIRWYDGRQLLSLTSLL